MMKLLKNRHLPLVLLVPLIYLVISVFTLKDYGINWDAPSHLQRGQAYLHYYLTRKNDYTDLKEWKLYREKEEEVKTKTAADIVPRYRLYHQDTGTIFFKPDIPKNEIPRISLYQNTGADLNYISANYDYGHPHISDVLSSVSNYIFFQKLGIINDVDSYRIYGVLLASVLVGLVYWWAASSFGLFAGIIAALALSTYPLFWAESHFNNEKDIPQAVYYSLMLYSVWRGITDRGWKWIVASGIFFGLALGTKFNVVFSVFIILPWLLVYLIWRIPAKFSLGLFLNENKKLISTTLAAPILGILLVLSTWPFFWSEPLRKVGQLINFYTTIGTDANIDPRFLGPLGINIYPALWILFTTPPVTLFLALWGIFVCLKKIRQREDKFSLLLLLWLIVPIARVTWPGTNIYGGVRQIIEFVPALAIIAGIGASQIILWLYSHIVKLKMFRQLTIIPLQIFVLLLFSPIVFKLIQIHPNENVYFNPLIGGLGGARDRDFPGWGVSFGSPYREAIEWINKNVEPGAKVTLSEILSNIPGVFIRPDIRYREKYASGYLMQGEYVISLRFQGAVQRSYFDMYLERMFEPVHQIVVDNVPILKIWKNDKDHLKPEWENEVILENLTFVKKDNGILFDIGQQVKLSRLEIEYDASGCPELAWGYIMLSKDGEAWERAPGVLPEEVRIKTLGIQPRDGKFIEPFAGQEARYIHLILSPPDTCLMQVKSSELHYFK